MEKETLESPLDYTCPFCRDNEFGYGAIGLKNHLRACGAFEAVETIKTIKETIERGIRDFDEVGVTFEDGATFCNRFAAGILQAVVDGLPPVLGSNVMNLQYKKGNNDAVKYTFNQLKKAIADLSK
jgi:hypothetical protein